MYLLSGGSAIVATLPTAATAGNGFLVIVTRAANGAFSSTQYTIATSGSDTFYINTTTATSLKLSTPAETYTLVSDGVSTWQIVEHECLTNWIPNSSAPALTITATTTAPGKGSVQADSVVWRRIGNCAEIMYSYNQTSAGTAGSGDYIFALPSGLTADTSNLTLYTTVVGNGSPFKCTNVVGHGTASGNADSGIITLSMYDSTHFRAFITTSSVVGAICSVANQNLSVAVITYQFRLMVPISGWLV
jgi:hypothetical protein